MASMRSVTSPTLGWVSAGYQLSVSITRLHPISSLGVTLAQHCEDERLAAEEAVQSVGAIR